MKQVTVILLMMILLIATNITKGQNNEAIVRGLLDAVRYNCEMPPSGNARKLISIDRIYVPSSQGNIYEAMTISKRLIKKDKRVIEADTIYSKWIFSYTSDNGRPNYVVQFREDYDSPEEYKNIINDKDRTAQTAYSKGVTVISDATNNNVDSGKMMRFLTIEAPAQIAARDEDVLAAKKLLEWRPPDGRFDKESEVTKQRKDTYLKVSYHIGRISFRRDALAKIGKVAEKNQQLAEKQHEWAVKSDTHSMMFPKPTLENILILESPAEAFARRLSEAYYRELENIRAGVKIITSQLIVDTEDKTLWVDAKEQENKGKMGLGGENGIQWYEVAFGRFVVPVLEELKKEPANNPAEALRILVSTLVKVDAQVAQRTTEKLKNAEN